MRAEKIIAIALISALLACGLRTVAQQSEPRPTNLAREVRHQLLLLPYYSVFDNLGFRVEGSKIVLIGQVIRPALKSDAAAAAKSVEGVSDVENDIEVLPPAPMDDQIRRETFRAIYGDSAMTKYGFQAVPPIHIIVKGGHVTLEGVVDTEADKNLANLRAKGVPNVFDVQNNLQVAGMS